MTQDNDRHEVEETLRDALRTAETITQGWQQDSQQGSGSGQDSPRAGRAQEPIQQGSGAATTTLVPQDRSLRDDDGPMTDGPYQPGQLVSVLPERHGAVWVGRWQGLMVNGTAVIRHETQGYRLYVPADGLGRIVAAAA